MPGPSVFADEWRACLRAHYMHVIRERDTVTERTLVDVLRRVGFTETELAELRVLATMHVDRMGADFTPDLEALAAHEPPVYPAVALEPTEMVEDDSSLLPPEDEAAPHTAEPEPDDSASIGDDPSAADAPPAEPGFQQLSLF
ncbi:MAG: hypothetical protein SNJ59_07575 [Aggregatilineales bacterium]